MRGAGSRGDGGALGAAALSAALSRTGSPGSRGDGRTELGAAAFCVALSRTGGPGSPRDRAAELDCGAPSGVSVAVSGSAATASSQEIGRGELALLATLLSA